MSRSLKMHPFYQLMKVRVLEFIRQPEAIFWVYVFPLIMVVALGLAFRSEPVESMAVDIQEGPAAETIKESLETDPRFRVQISNEQEARRRLRVGKAELIVVAGESAESKYRYLYDPTRPGSLLARNATDDVLQRAAGREDVIATSDTEVRDPGSRYIDFLIPGLIGMGLMGGGMWGVGFAIVDMRIRQLLKRFLGTPMKKNHFLAAMMCSRLLFTIPEIVVLLVFSRLIFGVQNQGCYGIVGLLVILGGFEFAGIGLLVASRAKTLEAVSGLMNLVMVPMWIGSGIFFSPDRFPDFVQPFIKLLPLTPLISALRRVMLEGVGLSALGTESSIILGWGLVTFLIALRTFRWD
ncbi:MAG: ABC transporter permease [Planctomycetaceae bacterium]|nr:ABC transporter permease [Planctomycetaceae bacterium]